MGAGCLLVAALLEWGSPPVGRWLLETGYHRRVASLLQAGQAREALGELEASTLLDEEAVALLGRIPPVSSLAPVVQSDARLRRAIARQLIDELGSTRGQGAELRTLVESATANAEILVKLAPDNAQSRLLLGLVYLKRGELHGAPIDFMLSARQLQTALTLDPEIPTAAGALRVARALAQAQR